MIAAKFTLLALCISGLSLVNSQGTLVNVDASKLGQDLAQNLGQNLQVSVGQGLSGEALINVDASQAAQYALQNALQNAVITVLAAKTPVPAPAPAPAKSGVATTTTGRKLLQPLNSAAAEASNDVKVVVQDSNKLLNDLQFFDIGGAIASGRKLHQQLVNVDASQLGQNLGQNLAQNAQIDVLGGGLPLSGDALINVDASQALQYALQNALQNAQISVLAAKTPVPAPAPAPASKASG